MNLTKHRLTAGAAVIAVSLFASACSETVDDGPETAAEGARTAQLALTADILGDTDIGGMEFTVEEVDCNTGSPLGPTESKTTDFEDLYLPGGIPLFERAPYHEDSTHIFADQAFWLDAGCYDVTVQPLDQQGAPSDDCYPAHAWKVQVHDGQTTEILLISQCLGPARGLLDVIGTINHPPEIDDLEYRPSKFVAECHGVEICVTASDPDGDPLEFEWSQASGPALQQPIAVSSTTMNNDGSITQCGTVQPTEKGTYEVDVTVYDLAYDEQQQIARIEDLLTAQGDPHESRDEARVPVHAGVECPVRGRTAVMLMTMRNRLQRPRGFGPSNSQARRLARNAVNFVNPTINPDPSVLIIRDDNHNGEQVNDWIYIRNRLQDAGFTNITLRTEPSFNPGGVEVAELAPYDVVWFNNPGWPMDDIGTYNALMDYLNLGGGLVLQGDDMASFNNQALSMTPFTKLNFVSNGTTTCGLPTDSNTGFKYRVSIPSNGHPLTTGLVGESFLYGNDIDHTTRTFTGEDVVARATLEGPVPRRARACARTFSTPVVIGIEP